MGCEAGMEKGVMFAAAMEKAAKFGRRLGLTDEDGERSSLRFPPLRKDLADMTGELIVWLTALKARLEQSPANPPRIASDVRRKGLDGRLIHRTVRGEMVRSKSEVAIANILFGIEREGRLKYSVEPELPFANRSGRQADFMIEANGATWFWEHCGVLSDEAYRRRFEQKKALYANNGYSIYSPDNPAGRLIVTEDNLETGLDTHAIDQLSRKLFCN